MKTSHAADPGNDLVTSLAKAGAGLAQALMLRKLTDTAVRIVDDTVSIDSSAAEQRAADGEIADLLAVLDEIDGDGRCADLKARVESCRVIARKMKAQGQPAD